MKRAIAVILVLAFVAGCTGLDTPEKKALAVRESFNQGLAEYILIRPDLPAEKVERVDGLFRLAAASLNLYEDKAAAGTVDQLAMEEFLANKREITKEVGGLIGWKE